jgi:hypothetical protein
MEFKALKLAVAAQFVKMQKQGELFRINVAGDDLWNTYLGSFPEGTNPIYRKRTEHDCSCCRNFIRQVGNVVAITSDNKLMTLWDAPVPDEPAYEQVSKALADHVRSAAISGFFRTSERTIGVDKNYEKDISGGLVTTWNHFSLNMPSFSIIAKGTIPEVLGNINTACQVYQRGLDTITADAIGTVLELIAQNSIYRGAEFEKLIKDFRKIQAAYDKVPDEQKQLFVWRTFAEKRLAALNTLTIRNTVIGTLLVDLSEGVELDQAVRSFESKVAPANYKRTTALVTPKMVAQAKEKLQDLGLWSALERRYARTEDITINDILYVDRSVRSLVTADAFDELAAASAPKAPKSFDRVDEISIENFIKKVVPTVHSIEVLFSSEHEGNLVSLVAPVNPDDAQLFKWNNGFSWAYNGDVTDSIKQRVKAAGGNVTGELCCRLAWFNYDDLDFHMIEPDGYEIYFGNRSQTSPNGGRLDVDMNAGQGSTREPVENIFYASCKGMKEGIYKLVVNQFCRREQKDVGFTVEVDYKGQTTTFSYNQMVANKRDVVVGEFEYTKARGFVLKKTGLSTTAISKKLWGLSTNQFQKVKLLTLSPNYWHGQEIGNKHYMFMLEGCVNDGFARGFFNEYLKGELTPHRKVLEIIGSKMQLVDEPNQLSGLGFSSTQKAELICRVTGATTRVLKVVF